MQPAGPAADVVVVGAGAFGSWTAWFLREAGARVTLVDAYGPGNARASSGGETRLMRQDYGATEIYMRMAIRAYEHWRRYQDEWGVRLFTETGRLIMATPGGQQELDTRKARLERNGVETQVFGVDELRRRWPQIESSDVAGGLFNPRCALLHAREACREVANRFVASGGTYRVGRARLDPNGGARLSHVTLEDGTRIATESVVFACGPWLKTLFPSVLGERLAVIRRDVFFIGTPAGDARFSHPRLPTWGVIGPTEDKASLAFYGFPDVDGRGVKVCPTNERNEFDPDRDDRRVNPYQAQRAYDYVARRFPGLRGQPIVETRACQVTNTADSHFLVDRHPNVENVWLVGGGSAHGFKHGPAMGQYVAARVLNSETVPEYDQTFALNRPPSG